MACMTWPAEDGHAAAARPPLACDMLARLT